MVLIAGPANMDNVARKALTDTLQQATSDPEYADKLKKAGYVAVPLTGAELQKRIGNVYALINQYESWIPQKK